MPTAYCPTCERAVHLGAEDARFCPVCTSPLSSADSEITVLLDAADRIARNEALFREANERIRDAVASPPEDGSARVGFVCECGQPACDAPVLMTVPEYEAVRAHPTWFFTLPGHEVPEVEVVVERRGHFQVVEKLGPARRLVREVDRRSS